MYVDKVELAFWCQPCSVDLRAFNSLFVIIIVIIIIKNLTESKEYNRA